jgi:predicted metal-binding protein
MMNKLLFEDLRRFAVDLGAVDAKIISTNDVVVENRVVLKCKYGCSEYGRNWSCPPYVPSVEEFRSILKEYEYAMIVVFQSSAELNDLENFYKVWNEEKRKAHEAILKLEKYAFNKGFTFALGMIPGSCKLCSKCDVTKPCIHPEMLRFSPESVGVNLIKTLENAKISLKFPIDKSVGKLSTVTMLLIS